MRPIIRVAFFFVLFATLTSAAWHKYYVAVFQVDFVPQKKEIQITGRIFTDDLEKALDTKYGRKFYLSTSKEAADTKEILKRYFADKMNLKVNGSEKTITFLGKETEDDVLVCYFKAPADKKLTSMEMRNTVLFEMFREQQNIIQTKISNERKSLLLTYDTPNGTLTF